MPVPDVLVLGAGVIGLTAAVTIAEAGHRTTVIADEIPGRTSLAAGASWGPYHVEPHDKVNTWGRQTLTTLTELAAIPGTGVRTVCGIEASRSADGPPAWTHRLPDVLECRSDELPPGFGTGWRYTVPVIDMPLYLDYLLGRLRAAHGTVERHHIADVTGLTSVHEVVVNCSGLGAREVAGDEAIYPIRGQLVVVTNPGIDTFFSEDTGASQQLTHYLPHGDTVILGGTALPGNWSREPDPATTQAIVDRCAQIQPLLRSAHVLEERVGLRPTRPRIRLETETTEHSLLIHNYGHGGAGVSLSWGCAVDVLKQVQSHSRHADS
ncbi:MAG: FAD-dependent oxidoreductase [Micromonosporaceae bacterium]